jgi:hypothetical protein
LNSKAPVQSLKYTHTASRRSSQLFISTITSTRQSLRPHHTPSLTRFEQPLVRTAAGAIEFLIIPSPSLCEVQRRRRRRYPSPLRAENKPFKDREDVMAEIRNCDRFGGLCQCACFGFAALGAISDVVNVPLGLEPPSWFLLAIVAGVNAIIGHTHVVVAKQLLGIEAERSHE